VSRGHTHRNRDELQQALVERHHRTGHASRAGDGCSTTTGRAHRTTSPTCGPRSVRFDPAGGHTHQLRRGRGDPEAWPTDTRRGQERRRLRRGPDRRGDDACKRAQRRWQGGGTRKEEQGQKRWGETTNKNPLQKTHAVARRITNRRTGWSWSICRYLEANRHHKPWMRGREGVRRAERKCSETPPSPRQRSSRNRLIRCVRVGPTMGTWPHHRRKPPARLGEDRGVAEADAGIGVEERLAGAFGTSRARTSATPSPRRGVNGRGFCRHPSRLRPPPTSGPGRPHGVRLHDETGDSSSKAG